jgi:hypothetical protein
VLLTSQTKHQSLAVTAILGVGDFFGEGWGTALSMTGILTNQAKSHIPTSLLLSGVEKRIAIGGVDQESSVFLVTA